MKNLAIAVLLLFAASLFGSAFASGCIAARAAPDRAQAEMPSCCALKVGCAGASCLQSIDKPDCLTDADSFAVVQKLPTGDDIKTPVSIPAPTTALLLIDSRDVDPPSILGGYQPIAGYADIYARTGRLLI